MATNRHFGKDQSGVMADAETPMEVESLPVTHSDGAPANAVATTADAPMQQEGEEEKEEMPFMDDELAVCFKVSTIVLVKAGHAASCDAVEHTFLQW